MTLPPQADAASMARDMINDPDFQDILPSSFLYGCSSASHQIEGGYLSDGKGMGIWDQYLANQDNGQIACDSYNMWRDDIQLLKKYGCTTYRFSVAWSRVKPQGGSEDTINEAGIEYYSRLVDALLAEGIQPCVTIFHWDYPLHLAEKYGAFDSEEEVVRDFVAYADLLFERLGDRVKHWITINEPHIFAFLSQYWLTDPDTHRPSFTGRYTRTLLLCHAKTVHKYRQKYVDRQKGLIGITLDCEWPEPIDDSDAAAKAAQLNLDWVMGLYADPICSFPKDVVEKEGAEILYFSDEEWLLVKGSADFFGLNHYGSYYVNGKALDPTTVSGPALGFGPSEKVMEKDGVIIGNPGKNAQPHDVPWGFRKILQYIHKRYTASAKVPIYITESGFAIDGEDQFPLEQQIQDEQRQHYYAGYLRAMFEAIRDDGIDVGGYMAWSLLDNLEWAQGYATRFGVTIVDRDDGCRRIPKNSALLLRDVFEHALKA